MKNYYLPKQIKSILLFVFLLIGIMSYSQSVSKNPIKDLENQKTDMPKVPQNYTATRVALSNSASAESKAEFVKKNGADYYYIYTNLSGKIISKEELEEVLRKETQETKNNNTATTLKK
jgi:hypothetical protein